MSWETCKHGSVWITSYEKYTLAFRSDMGCRDCLDTDANAPRTWRLPTRVLVLGRGEKKWKVRRDA